ncbi:MAG TPA: hypothetical protein VFZ61_03410, partial [Polyangiales bacterium]
MSPPPTPLFPSLRADNARPALRVAEHGLSHAQLAVAHQAFRARLASLGVGPGERVLVWAHPD